MTMNRPAKVSASFGVPVIIMQRNANSEWLRASRISEHGCAQVGHRADKKDVDHVSKESLPEHGEGYARKGSEA